MLIPEKDAQLHVCPLRSTPDRLVPCLGNTCAAWRGATILRRDTSAEKPALEKIEAGYCGLAGVPPEVSSSQAFQLLAEIPSIMAMLNLASADVPGEPN